MQSTDTIQEQQEKLDSQRQNLIEKCEELNQLKRNWDSLSSQHQNSSQRYMPNNIEVSQK